MTAFAGLAACSPADAVARLAALAAALPGCDDPRALEDLAASLPDSVADLEPEVCLALQDLAMALVPHGPNMPGDLEELEPRLRSLWRRVQLSAGDSAALMRLDDAALLHVVHGWSIDDVLAPAPLLRRMAAAGEPRLRSRLLAWIHPAVHQLALGPAEAVALLLPLAEDPDPSLRARAVELLAEAWVHGLPPALLQDRDAALARALLDEHESVAHHAVAAAATLGRRDWLLALVLPGDAPPLLDALAALGPLAQDEDLAPLLALAASDPLRNGPAVRRFVLAAHRHGVFIRATHLDALLAAFDAHPTWTGEELARVTHIVRGELVDRLATLPIDDERWIRRADILATSVDPRAPELLLELLTRVRDPSIATALISAAGRSPSYAGEAPLLTWLTRLPEVVAPVLRIKGGAAAESQLHALALGPHCPPATRALLLDALWSLSRDRGALLRELSAALGPHESGLLGENRRTHRDGSIAAIAVAAAWPEDPAHTIEPARLLSLLCESGDLDHLPRIVELFREQFRGLVRQALAGDFTIKRIAIPELEQQLFRYGRHLIKNGRGVRRWIDAAPETGRDLVLQVALDWLREGPTGAVCVALLELVGRHAPGPVELRMIEPFWRHREREVRRAAIEAILAAGEGARGLELSLCRLAGDDEPRILGQALAAVATLRATWAEPIALAALQRPEMAIKKDAAHALAQIAGGRSIPTLVEWLAHHDNRGLRDELRAALAHATGPALVAVLVDALTHETEPRRIDLLIDALAGRLPLAAALRLARSSQPAHRRLLTACLEGQVTLADATAEQLAARLHRARLLPRIDRDDPGRALRIEGFTPEAARTLVGARTQANEAAVLATVRGALADWIAWLHRAAVVDPRALALVLDAATPQHAEHLESLLTLAEQQRATVDTAALAGLLERCVAGRGLARALEVRAIGLLRTVPRASGLGGLRRFRLLARLGAVRTRDDLDRSLDETRLGPDHARDSAALLADALAIPDERPDEPPALTDLRDYSRRWHAMPAASRDAWLTAALRERPLDLPPVPALPAPARPRFSPASRRDLDDLCATITTGDEQERARAATRLLAWPDAAPAWPQVLAAYLAGRIDLGRDQLSLVAPLLLRWPATPDAAARALELLPHCPPHRRRAFIKEWIAAWLAGDKAADAPLRAVDDDLLLPHVWAAAEAGEFRLARLLRPARSLAHRSLIAYIGARSPADVAHLVAAPPAPTPIDVDDPDDPIAGRGPDELVALIDAHGVARGLAVRAVHALATHGERGVAPLERLVVDPRPPVRSAALRALRTVAAREPTLAATARALAMETRVDVMLGLMKSLGHGRHEPALPALLERLDHREPKIREGARQAILGWGPDVVPALRRAARRARPDRRPTYAALIDSLEQIEA